MQGKKTWALVADGSRAIILRGLKPLRGGAGQDATPQDEEDIAFEAANLRASDYISDKPGRAFSSASSRRSSMEMTSDPVRIAEQDFASTLIGELETHHKAGHFDRLALIAAPQMLGDLRSALPASLKNAVVAEIAKDLTKIPSRELRATVNGTLADIQSI